jgi:hypothetical protein
LVHFNPELKNIVDDFKKVHQYGRMGEYIQQYERVKARVIASQFSNEQYYLFEFFSGLKR